jgi:hypothetical protein
MPLLAGGVADANERLVESKLVVWLRSPLLRGVAA